MIFGTPVSGFEKKSEELFAVDADGSAICGVWT
jgi:hypothetical protein